MTSAGDHPEPPHGLVAVLWAFVAQVLAMVQRRARPRELARSLAVLEVRLALALFGGGLAADDTYGALSHEQRRAQRRAMVLDYLALRRIRLRGQRIATALGQGYRRAPILMMAIRFERRIALRRMRRFSCTRLAFVATTREVRAGAPP